MGEMRCHYCGGKGDPVQTGPFKLKKASVGYLHASESVCSSILHDRVVKAEGWIEALKGCCLSEVDHALFCEEVLKIKGDWCPMCRALDSIGISQKKKREA